MNIVRTILWVLILVALLVFSWANWDPGISVRIWSNLVVDTRLPAIVVLSFLAGLLPTWLYHRGVVWSLQRRIKALETAAQPAGTVRTQDRVVDGAPSTTASATAERAADHPFEGEHRPARPDDSPVAPIRP